MIRTKTQIIDAFEKDLEDKIPDLDLNNTTVANVFVDAPATQISITYEDMAHAQRIQSLENVNEMTIDELGALAYNYKLTRLPGTKSAATIRMFRKTLPTSPIIIALGTTVATRRSLDTPSVSFQTLQERIFSDAVGGYDGWDTTESAYYIDIAIEALNIGVINNVASKTIIDIVSNIRGLDFIYNPLAATGGADQEDNETLAERIRTKASGGQLNTLNGYKNLVMNNFILRDVAIVGPTDVEMIRNPYGNAVDIIFIGETLTSEIDTVTYYNVVPITSHYFAYVPVSTDYATSITGIDATSGTLILEEGAAADFEIRKDASTIKNSNRAKDKIVFHIRPAKTPMDGSNLSIGYVYNKLVSDIQQVIDADENKIVGSDALVKEAERYLVDIAADITILTGYDFTTVANAITTTITNNLAEYVLGQHLDRSDIVAWIYTVEGVDSVDLDTLLPATDIIVDKLMYIKLQSVVIT